MLPNHMHTLTANPHLPTLLNQLASSIEAETTILKPPVYLRAELTELSELPSRGDADP